MSDPAALRAHERATLLVFATVAAGWLAFHLAALTLFCLPPNPLGERFRPAVTAYAHPYFEQYWNMFAPNPIDGEYTLAARARSAGRHPRISGWIDVTGALIGPSRGNPLSPVQTLRLDSMKVTLGLLQDRSVMRLQLNGKRSAPPLPRLLPMPLAAAKHEALYFGRAAWDGDAPVEGVQIAVVAHAPPRYTHRFDVDDPGKNTRTVYFPWLSARGDR